jgi:hypothetical protein
MSSAKARNDMRELKEIKTEIDRLNTRVKELKEKKAVLEESIATYLEQTDQPGIKYEDMVVLARERKVRERKKNADKQDDIVRLLEESGISNSKGLYKQITEAMKGKEQVKTGLQIKTQEKKK